MNKTYYYLGSRPIEPHESDRQWFLVGTYDENIGDFADIILFSSMETAKEYLSFQIGKKLRINIENPLTSTETICNI